MRPAGLATMLAVLLALLITTTPGVARAATEGDRAARARGEESGDYRPFVSAGAMAGSGSLVGWQAAYGKLGWRDSSLAWGTIWLSRLVDGDQDVTGLRADAVPISFQRRWAAAGPLFSVGLDHRSEQPDEGLGGFVGLGAGAILGTATRWHVTVGIQRAFGISMPSRNQAHLSVGVLLD